MSTRKQVWQYRCDFCPKKNLSASGISKHEKHCTNNPNRECRMCEAISTTQKPIATLIPCLSLEKTDFGIDDLRAAAEGCPMCMLAAIRQSKIREKYKTEHPQEFSETGPLYMNWDYKAELKSVWDAINTRY